MATQPDQQDNETLPISSARLIAYLSLVMSVGFVLLIYLVVLGQSVPFWVLLIMFGLVMLSDYVAMQRLRQKISCPRCTKPFFSSVLSMFLTPRRCGQCQYNADEADVA